MCSQCGAEVESGRPFCPKCGAPQIKVPVRPPTAPVTEPLPPGTPGDLQPPAEPIVDRGEPVVVPPPGVPRSSSPNKLSRQAAFRAALLAGVLAAIGTSIPVVPLAMLCMFAAGGLAVTLYRRRAGFRPVTTWMGVKIGLLAGALGFGLRALPNLLVLASGTARSSMRSLLVDKLRETAANAPDPEVARSMQQFGSYITTDHGLIVVILVLVLIAAVFFLLFSALGGALGAMLFGRDGARKE